MRMLFAGVEVGVHRGLYSNHVLTHWKGRKLHLVDPWGRGGTYDLDRTDDLQQTLDNVRPFPGRCALQLRARSHQLTSCLCG
jgi:hypothetical protein